MTEEPRRARAKRTAPKRAGGARSIGDLLAGFVKETSLGRGVCREDLAARWEAVCGPALARRTRVVGLKHGVLEVEVEGGALLSELSTFERARLEGALVAGRGAAGKITKLKLKLAGGEGRRPLGSG